MSSPSPVGAFDSVTVNMDPTKLDWKLNTTWLFLSSTNEGTSGKILEIKSRESSMSKFLDFILMVDSKSLISISFTFWCRFKGLRGTSIFWQAWESRGRIITCMFPTCPSDVLILISSRLCFESPSILSWDREQNSAVGAILLILAKSSLICIMSMFYLLWRITEAIGNLESIMRL